MTMKASLTPFDINNPRNIDDELKAKPELDRNPITTNRSEQSDSLIHAIIDRTEEPSPGLPAVSSFIIGKCHSPYHPDKPGLCQVKYATAEGRSTIQWLRHMKGHSFGTGDSVLLVTPLGAAKPVILGCLAKMEPAGRQEESGGRRLIIDRKEETHEATGIRLELPDGRTLIEIDLKTDVPTIRIPDKDLSLDIEGRLKIAARSIDFESKLGSVNVKANDDFKVNAERIYLN